MAKIGTSDAPPEDLLEIAFYEYLQRIDAGEDVDRRAFVSRYPEVADALAAHLDADSVVRRMAGPTYAEATTQGGIDATFIGDAEIGDAAIIPADSDAGSVAEKDSVIAAHSDDTHPSGQAQQGDLPAQFGRYRVEKLLGQGAMGSVYLAHDTQLDRRVALKIPKFDQAADAEMLERFYREARAVATLHHPNVCPVYDVGEIDGRTFLSMAYIEGRPLSDYTKSQKKQGERSVAKLVMKLARALQDAHEIGVVHRDLKPANIMVGKKGEPVVMDFGLARRLGSNDTRVTRSGTIVGTPAYMSPEQVEGDPDAVGPASDQYSLGVILYEMLTGRLPFQGTILSVIGQIAHKQPQEVSELRPDLDPRLAVLCRKMMAKNPADRFKDMAAAADALNKYLVESKTGVSPTDPAADQSIWDVVPENETITPLKTDRRPSLGPTVTAKRGEPRRKASRPWKHWTAVGALSLVVIAAAVVLLLQTPDGTVRIEIADPETQVEFAGQTFTFEDEGTQVEVTPGRHKLFVKRGALSFKTEEFIVEKNGEAVIKVSWQASELAAAIDGRKIGSSRKPTDETKPADTQDQEWTLLFNGRDLTGWRRYRDGAPVTGWTVDDGALHLPGKGGGDIMTADTYGDFELEFEWMISEGGNSGVIYRARTGDPAPYQSGPEYQIVDDERHRNGRNPKTSAASMYSVFAPQNKTLRPVGQWNTGRIVARGNHLEHWLNGEKVVDADIGSDRWNQARSQQSLIQWPQFGTVREGRIVLQDHGAAVRYRNIRVRRLPASGTGDEPNPNDFALVHRFEGHRGSGEGGVALGVSGDGRWMISAGGYDRTARLWNLESRKSVLTLAGPPSTMNRVAISHDGKRGAGFSSEGQLAVWDLETGKEIHSMAHDDRGFAIAFSPSGRRLITASEKGVAILWDVESGKEVARHNFGDYVEACLLRDDDHALVASKELFAWDVAGGKVEPIWPNSGSESMAISADGRTMATSRWGDHLIQTWDMESGRPIQRFSGHDQKATSLRFLPNQRYLITGGTDGRIIIWDLQTGREAARKEGLGHLANTVLPLPDGRHAVSFGRWYEAKDPNPVEGDTAIHLWRLPKSVWPPEETE